MCRQRQFVDELRFLFGFILKSLFIIILRFSVRIIVVLIVCIFVIRILIIENTKNLLSDNQTTEWIRKTVFMIVFV